jgi:alanyl-tRNA synthetase
MALFGEKYGDVVRVVEIGGNGRAYSRELCGGTHVNSTAQIGGLHIISEGSAAAGVRRIEAVTGQVAQELTQQRLRSLEQTASLLGVPPEGVYQRAKDLMNNLQESDRKIKSLQRRLARLEFETLLGSVHEVDGTRVVSVRVEAPDTALLREMSDWFRDRMGSGVVVLGTVLEGKPSLIATVTEDLVKRGLHAGKLVKSVAELVDGSGGGKPTMAQAGGRDVSRLDEALARRVDALVGEAISKK